MRNPDYWKKDKPYLDGNDFNIVSNPSTAILSFITDRFDLTFPWEVTPDDRKLVRKDAPQAICETTSMNLNLNLLVNGTAAPFDNPDIRRAIVLALDRKAFVDDDVKNLSQNWAVAPALVKLALRDDRRSQTHKEPHGRG